MLTIIEENHTATQAMRQMPYLASLAGTYGHTTDYHAITHPSLPNYLALVGGSTFGVTDDQPPAHHPLRGDTVFDQALAAGRTAKVYAESMPGSCHLTNTSAYAARHNPWTYFSDPVPRANCRQHDVPAGSVTGGALHDDLARGALPQVGLLIPNLCHDGHDCSLASADTWLRTWVPALLDGPDYRAGRLTIVITFDEDDYHAGNVVLTTVISPGIKHATASRRLSHYSWTRWMDEALGTAPLRQAATAPSLAGAFGR